MKTEKSKLWDDPDNIHQGRKEEEANGLKLNHTVSSEPDLFASRI